MCALCADVSMVRLGCGRPWRCVDNVCAFSVYIVEPINRNVMKNDELMNRRRFFKKTAKEMLPMLGAFVAAPTILTTMTSCGCDGCEATCSDDCDAACHFQCTESCSNNSQKSSCSGCWSECSVSSTASTCSNCSNNCSSSCNDTCKGSSTGTVSDNIDGHEYVDLGLSVLWATYDIGASKEGEEGSKLPFVLADEYDTANPIKWYEKYTSLKLEPYQTISGTSLDIAKSKWGNKWRMPSVDEVYELAMNTRVEEIAGKGIKITSEINGKNIYFPLGKTYYWAGETGEEFNQRLKAGFFIISSSGFWAGQTFQFIAWDYNDITLYCIRPVSERSNSGSSTCNGSCSGICSNDCNNTCINKCKESCKGGCGEDCTTGCTKSCSDDCSGSCSKTCTGQCKGNCTGGCTSCTGGCSSSCTGNCSGGCKGDCNTTCTTNCAQNCASGCSSGCSSGCVGGCYTGCEGGCDGGCYYGCSGHCGTGCGTGCSGGCDSTCHGGCDGRCRGLNITAW